MPFVSLRVWDSSMKLILMQKKPVTATDQIKRDSEQKFKTVLFEFSLKLSMFRLLMLSSTKCAVYDFKFVRIFSPAKYIIHNSEVNNRLG